MRKIVREAIAKYLEENGIKQNHLASKIDMSPVTFNTIINGSRKIDIEEYVKICNALGVSYEFFLQNPNTINSTHH